MDEADDQLALKVQALSDLELAVLLCLVAEQHCIIEAERGSTSDVAEELRLVNEPLVFNLFTLLTIVDCK